MAETKHTPGPWNVERSGGAWAVYAADPSEHADPGDLMVIADYQSEANARLIAAAPEMKEKLVESLNMAGRPCNDYEGRRGPCTHPICAWIVLVRALLDKAEGR